VLSFLLPTFAHAQGGMLGLSIGRVGALAVFAIFVCLWAGLCDWAGCNKAHQG